MVHKTILNEARVWMKRLEPIMDRLTEIAENDPIIEDFRLEYGIENDNEDRVPTGHVKILIFCAQWEIDHMFSNRGMYFYLGEEHTERNWEKITRMTMAVNLLAKKDYNGAFNTLAY